MKIVPFWILWLFFKCDFWRKWYLAKQKEIGEGICEYHIFDMGDFSNRMPKDLKRAHYHQWGLEKQDPSVDKPVPGKQFYGLRDTIRLLGHEDLDVIDIFKIDCESCEWDTYMDWLAEGIPLLHQIQVETHGAPIEKALGFFDTLESAGYLRYHKEANILVAAPWAAFGQCFEYGMVKVCSHATCHFFSTIHVHVLLKNLCLFYLCTSLSLGVYRFHEWEKLHFQQNEVQNGPWTYYSRGMMTDIVS